MIRKMAKPKKPRTKPGPELTRLEKEIAKIKGMGTRERPIIADYEEVRLHLQKHPRSYNPNQNDLRGTFLQVADSRYFLSRSDGGNLRLYFINDDQSLTDIPIRTSITTFWWIYVPYAMSYVEALRSPCPRAKPVNSDEFRESMSVSLLTLPLVGRGPRAIYEVRLGGVTIARIPMSGARSGPYPSYAEEVIDTDLAFAIGNALHRQIVIKLARWIDRSRKGFLDE